MIDPEFYKAVGLPDIINRIRSTIGQYRSLSSTHITWYTHKNPYGCWICDLLLSMETACNYLDAEIQAMDASIDKYTKSYRPDDMSGNSQECNQDDTSSQEC